MTLKSTNRVTTLLMLLALSASVSALWPAAPARAQTALAIVGDPAPDFALTGIDGRKVSLSEFAGKFVVLEWWGSECYTIKTHYKAGTMQGAQKRARADGAVWLSIDSTHPGHSSFLNASQTAEMLKKWNGAQNAMLQDPDGKVGRLYGASVTPHTVVIDPKGRLIYAGAIDDDRSMRDVRKARNLALAAIDEARAGKPVSRPLTKAYG